MRDTLIDLLRHGEPEGGRRFRGSAIDDPLTEAGMVQMRRTVGDQRPWSHIITSPLRRCRLFAEGLAAGLGIPCEVEEAFREVGFGAWEGQSPEQIIAREEARYIAFYRDPVRNRPEGAEPLHTFAHRVSSSLDRLMAIQAGKHLLVVTHAGVIRAALGHILGADPIGWYRCRVDYAGLTRIRQGKYGPKLEFHNRLSLEPE